MKVRVMVQLLVSCMQYHHLPYGRWWAVPTTAFFNTSRVVRLSQESSQLLGDFLSLRVIQLRIDLRDARVAMTQSNLGSV